MIQNYSKYFKILQKQNKNKKFAFRIFIFLGGKRDF